MNPNRFEAVRQYQDNLRRRPGTSNLPRYTGIPNGPNNMNSHAGRRDTFQSSTENRYRKFLSIITVLVILVPTIVTLTLSCSWYREKIGLNFPACDDVESNEEQLTKICIPKDLKEPLETIFYAISDTLEDMSCKHGCQPEYLPFMYGVEVLSLAMEKFPTMTYWEIENAVGYLNILIEQNPIFCMRSTAGGIELHRIKCTVTCCVILYIWPVMKYCFFTIVTFISIILGYRLWHWVSCSRPIVRKQINVRRLSREMKREIRRLYTAGATIDVDELKRKLIPHNHVVEYEAVWYEAFGKAMESLTCLIEPNGDTECECNVCYYYAMRNLSQRLRVSKRDLSEVYQPNYSMENFSHVTQTTFSKCLVIRNMFDPSTMDRFKNLDLGDIIVSKCSGVDIVHVHVDKSPIAWNVYLKCATGLEATLAREVLHGARFLNRPITADYVDELEYMNTFPNSRNASPIVSKSKYPAFWSYYDTPLP